MKLGEWDGGGTALENQDEVRSREATWSFDKSNGTPIWPTTADK
jgi:hypothetical protein